MVVIPFHPIGQVPTRTKVKALSSLLKTEELLRQWRSAKDRRFTNASATYFNVPPFIKYNGRGKGRRLYVEHPLIRPTGHACYPSIQFYYTRIGLGNIYVPATKSRVINKKIRGLYVYPPLTSFVSSLRSVPPIKGGFP